MQSELTLTQRTAIFPVLETLRECAERLSCRHLSAMSPTSSNSAVLNDGEAWVWRDDNAVHFHRLQETLPPGSLPRQREWYWDLARPAEEGDVERAVAIIRSLEAH